MSSPTPTPSASIDPSIIGIPFSTFFWIIIIALIALSVERIITSYLKRFTKRTKLEPNVANNLALAFRIIILISALIAISRVSGVSSEWLVSISAVVGAAVGFASQKTIGNFVAGIFLITAKPFRVGNYVRLGVVEGIVSEITINYTKVVTPGNSIVSVSNLQILERDITNFFNESLSSEGLYCYTFEIAFDHSVATGVVDRIFKEVLLKQAKELPVEPTFFLTKTGASERVYLVYLYVNNPEQIFIFRPRITDEVFRRWDEERAKIKTNDKSKGE